MVATLGRVCPKMTTCGCLGGLFQRLLLHSLCLLSLPLQVELDTSWS